MSYSRFIRTLSPFVASLAMLPLYGSSSSDICERVNAHIAIEDYRSACQEAKDAIALDPHNATFMESYITAMAKGGNEKEMIRMWQRYRDTAENPYSNRDLIETMGWCVIEKGSKSPSPLVRVHAVLGAHFGQDAKGVRILQRCLRDYNALVRDVAIQLSSELRDERLRREVLSLFSTEEAWPNKLTLIQALGRMKIHEATKPLMALVESSAANAELKAAAIQAITEIQDTISRKDVIALATSSRAGMRQLASEAIAAFDRESDLDQILPLLKDSNADVKISGLRAIGALRPEQIEGQSVPELIRPMVEDSSPLVAITASWLLMLYDPPAGQRAIEPWFNDNRQELRIFAAAALKASGKYGFPLIPKVFSNSSDPYVCMNLALAMIAQRQHIEPACRMLEHGLQTINERWMWKSGYHFKAIAPSTVKRNPAIPQLPEGIDQLVRLEILNILAVMEAPNTQEAIRKFLKERKWGVSAAASATLLTEGDDSAVNLVEELLDDADSTIRVQAALILSLWGGGEKAIGILQEAYPTADRELKEHILEGLANVGTKETIPFLVDKLSEPHPTLRIIAAAALLKTLYN